MKRVVLFVVLVVWGSIFREGGSQECVSGLMSAERVWQLGRVAGNRKSDLKEQQRIVPDISFTCSGTVTRWIVAGEWKDEDNLPEVLIWRETVTGSGIYTKLHGTVLPLSSRLSSEIYSFEAGSLDVQPGDILGLFEPDDSWLEFYYTDKYGPINYYFDTGDAETSPNGDFDISGTGSANDMPLITVEITPTDGSSAEDCIRNFATMEAIEIGLQQMGGGKPIKDEQEQQRLIPGINFTCHGFITKWIIAAKWDTDDNYPELQTWSSTDAITYTKQGATTFSVGGGSAEVTYYEYSPDPPHEFNDGDVLGMFIPDNPQLKLFFKRVDTAPLNYIADTGGGVVDPPEGDFSITDTDLDDPENAVPLIAVEVSIPPVSMSPTSSMQVPPQTSEMMGKASSAIPPVSISPTSSMQVPPQTSEMMGKASSVPTSTKEMADASDSVNPMTTPMPEPEDESSSSSSDNSGVTAAVVVVVLIVLLLVGIVGAVAAVIVFRRKRKVYDARSPGGMTNPVYSGESMEFKRKGSAVKEPVYETTGGIVVYEDVGPVEYTDPVLSQSGGGTLTQSCCVPTEDQRRNFGNVQDIYASISLASYTSEDNYFPESEIYWAPASNQSDLYTQLSMNKFREIPRALVRVAEHLGTGNFGQVNKGVWESPSGSVEVALKTLQPKATEIDRVKFLQEAAIMGQFHHPNVVTLYGVVTVEEPVMIVLELLPNGDLRQYLMKLQPIPGEMASPNTSQMCLDFCRQVTSGMEYLSKKAFIHRDLAARNILVSENRRCKISDFGMSRDLEDENYYVSHGGKIPVKWTAPEAINYKKYSTASDVWSYGALVYEIWSLGHKPFEGYTNMEAITLVNGGCRLPPPPGCPRAIYETMIHCWHPEAGSRPSFSDLVRSLSRPETELLKWTEKDTQTHPQAAVLGGPLDAGKNLYPDLQGLYMQNE